MKSYHEVGKERQWRKRRVKGARGRGKEVTPPPSRQDAEERLPRLLHLTGK